MGPSGSGKTTLMNIIGCLDTPTSGEYLLNNQPVNNFNDDELARIRNKEIGFVYADFTNIMENGGDYEYGDHFGKGYCGYYLQKYNNSWR